MQSLQIAGRGCASALHAAVATPSVQGRGAGFSWTPQCVCPSHPRSPTLQPGAPPQGGRCGRGGRRSECTSEAELWGVLVGPPALVKAWSSQTHLGSGGSSTGGSFPRFLEHTPSWMATLCSPTTRSLTRRPQQGGYLTEAGEVGVVSWPPCLSGNIHKDIQRTERSGLMNMY